MVLSTCGTQPGMIAGTCVFSSTHKPLSRSTDQHSRNQSLFPGTRAGGAPRALGWAEAVLCLVDIWKKGRKEGLSHPYCPTHPCPSSTSHGLLLLCPASLTATVLSATFVSQQEKAWQQIPKHHDRREGRVFQYLKAGRSQV